MPIYAYRCEACGHAKDVLQKISDPVLSTCPACGAEAFRKQVTAAGFQLKGSGWYVTDFRNGSQAAAKPADEAGKPAEDGPKADAKPAGEANSEKKADGKTENKTESKAAPAASPAPAPAPAPSPPAGGSSSA
ncbi:MAG TPA: FmdB family zinc ribbon protein [Methylibium sp.]|uniref:FmdB family zinc ribbon protein n=1 Tax=Methylibium sp. TaxID=2067992 RepID=UPI002DBA8A64|nr:FmdB family zinc ribbon protein [Methylibium sp.]HEU4459248.1 FmdB family zinc ribbon protein [Methylibium sp.]